MPQVKIGTVLSDKMKKTIVVKVEMKTKHPLYKKIITRSKKIKARNDLGAKVSQTVKITETSPIAKNVNFKVTEVIK